MTAIRRPGRAGLGLAALAGSLAFASSAVGAGVTLTDPTPASGASLQTTASGASFPLAWTSDTTGCNPAYTPSARVNVEDSRSDVFVLRNPVQTPLSGQIALGVSRPVPAATTVTYNVRLWCINAVSGQPSIEIFTETRTITLLPPDPRPRLMGTNRASIFGTLRYRKRDGRAARATVSSSLVMKVRPGCKVGPCTSVAVLSGLGGMRLRYLPRPKLWIGQLSPKQTGRLFTCRVGARRYRNVTTGRLTIRIRQKPKGFTKVVGAQTRAMQVQGTISGRIVTTRRGVNLGCPSGGPLTGTVRVSGV